MKINDPFCRERRTGSREPTCGKSCPVTHRRVLRGASWNNNDASNTLSSNRNNNDAGNRNNNNGFRCVLVVGGGKAFEPNNRRDGRPGQKPLRSRAKKSLTRMALPWRKQMLGRGITTVMSGAGYPRG